MAFTCFANIGQSWTATMRNLVLWWRLSLCAFEISEWDLRMQLRRNLGRHYRRAARNGFSFCTTGSSAERVSRTSRDNEASELSSQLACTCYPGFHLPIFHTSIFRQRQECNFLLLVKIWQTTTKIHKYRCFRHVSVLLLILTAGRNSPQDLVTSYALSWSFLWSLSRIGWSYKHRRGWLVVAETPSDDRGYARRAPAGACCNV